MLLVLADDFSGAAEIGGVAHRYGLKTEIQLKLNANSTADIIVLDTDTRSLSESDAVTKISEIGRAITKWEQTTTAIQKNRLRDARTSCSGNQCTAGSTVTLIPCCYCRPIQTAAEKLF